MLAWCELNLQRRAEERDSEPRAPLSEASLEAAKRQAEGPESRDSVRSYQTGNGVRKGGTGIHPLL